MSRNWLGVSFRVVLSVALVYAAAVIGVRTVAVWHSRQKPAAEGFRKAIEWNPGNATYYAGLARVQERSLQAKDLAEVIRLREKAVELSPQRARYWAELGSDYELAERLPEARRAYERALELFPNSPEINWRLGNFYLRQGELEPALPAFRKALEGDPGLHQQVFDLAWRAGAEPDRILEVVVPHDPLILSRYLDYLSARGHLEAADQVWQILLQESSELAPNTAFRYLDALLQARRVDQLVSTWQNLMEKSRSRRKNPGYNTNLAHNGDFESEILLGGLDWRLGSMEGVAVSIDNLNFFDGTRSLKIRFDGQRNVNYHHFFQLVPVAPNRRYRFLGYMQTKDITTDSGPYFELLDYYEQRLVYATTENLVGTHSWSAQQREFATGPDTHLLLLRVRRKPSAKIDNQIAGTVWIDRVSLTASE